MQASKQQMKQLGRLKKRSDFLRVGREGRKWVAKGLIVQAAENGLRESRFGLTVTKRLSKSAVVRNRVKRRLRAAACDILASRAQQGFDYVLIGRPETEKRLYRDLCKDLEWCLGKLGILKENQE